MKNSKAAPMPFKIDFEGTPDKKLPLKVFVFDSYDRLIESKDIDGNSFHLQTDDKTLRHAQVFIAPVTDAIALNPQPLPPQLEQIGAYRPVFQLDKSRLIDRALLPIPEIYWKNWYFCSCRVRGQVVKPFYIPFPFGSGFTLNMPVCHARVHICRLESLILKLPDVDIFKLRDDLLKLKPQFEIPRPIPRPEPIPDFHTHLMTMPEMEVASSKTDFSPPLSITLQNQLQTTSVGALRQILAKNWAELVYFPHFCWLYNCVEVAVTETDSNGRFDTRVWESCFNPNHNYYMWVEYLINGVWEKVYHPSYCAGAFWNYACGTDVTITVTDPRVPFGCRPTQTGSFFEVVSIGSGAIVSKISQRVVNNVVNLTKDLPGDDTGLIDTAVIDSAYTGRSPFGKSLTIRINSGLGFPSTEATHYRCIYKKSTDSDAPVNWKSVNAGSYFRYYNEEVELTPGNFQAFTKGYELKDTHGADFYKLTHEDVEDDLGVAVAPVINRVWGSDVYEIATLDTTNLANTHYDIRIEIYKKDAANNFTLTTVAKNVFKVPNPSNPTATMDAPDAFLTRVTQGAITSHAFEMTIRVDNNKCDASIDNAIVSVGGVIHTSDTACGMVNYGVDKNVPLTVGFHAVHANNFANFSFNVTKGNSGSILSTSGHITDSPVLNFNNNDSPSHDHHFVSTGLIAATFLGKCNGAAFAENLNVTALATNGSVRLQEYDDYSTAAFAMIP